MFHPASLLLSWFGFALTLQWIALEWLLPIACGFSLAAVVIAPERSLNLLKRSRWLLVSLAVLYFLMTPGEFVPGVAGAIGITYEGLQQGGKQIALLLAMLASLALLHRMVGTTGLLAGSHWLLSPFSWREATVVRLMLVLEYLEQGRHACWREWLTPNPENETTLPDKFVLGMPQFHLPDCALLLFVAGVVIAVMIRS